MPRERREIVFTPEELEAAVRAYARMNPHFLPVAETIACRVEADRLTITVNAACGATVQQMRIEAKPEDTVALLVRYCIEHNVMLPRAGRKSVIPAANGLALLIELERLTEPG